MGIASQQKLQYGKYTFTVIRDVTGGDPDWCWECWACDENDAEIARRCFKTTDSFSHIKNFCKKFARDANYRKKWAEESSH